MAVTSAEPEVKAPSGTVRRAKRLGDTEQARADPLQVAALEDPLVASFSPSAPHGGGSGEPGRPSPRAPGAPSASHLAGYGGAGQVSRASLRRAPISTTQDPRRPATTVMAALESATAEGKELLLNALEAAQDRLVEAFTALSDSASAQAAELRKLGSTQFSDAGAALGDRAEVHKESLDSSVATAQTDVSTWVDGAEGQADTLFAEKRSAAEEIGTTEGGAVRASVTTLVTTGMNAISGDITQARSLGECAVASAGGEEGAREARATAAREITADSVDKLTDLRGEVSDFEGSGDSLAEDFSEQARDLGQQLDEQCQPLSEQLGAMGEDANATLAGTATDAQQAFSDAVLEGQTALTEGADDWQLELAGSLGDLQTGLEDLGAEATCSLREATSQTLETGEGDVQDFAAALEEVPLSDEQAATLATEAAAAVRDAYGSAATGVCGGVDQEADQIRGTSNDLDLAFEEQGTALAPALSGVVDEADLALGDATCEADLQIQSSVQTFTSAGDGMLEQVSSDLDGRMDGLRGEFVDRREQINAEVGEGIDAPVQESHEAVRTLPARISTAQTRAVERASQGWLSRQLSDLVDLLSDPGFLAAIGTGLLLAVIAVLLAPEGLGLLAIVGIGALIGAIAAGVGVIVNNALQDRPWYAGLGEALLTGALLGGLGTILLEALGVGLLGLGAISLFAGVSGAILNIVHGEPWDKNLLANMLLAPLLVLLGKYLGGRARGSRSRPVEEAPVEKATYQETQAQPRPEVPPPEGAGVREWVEPHSLRFSQKDVAPQTGDGTMTLEELTQSMRAEGWKGKGLQVVELEDGPTSLDNRRLVAAREAPLKEVPIDLHDPAEPFPQQWAKQGFVLRYTIRQLPDGTLTTSGTEGVILLPKGHVATTYGEAMLIRTANQGNVSGGPGAGERFPLGGRLEQPIIRKGSGE